MITIDKIDFSRLKSYDGNTTKCFEQFCYQIAKTEYEHLGDFTPIDGSGGDGGIEFYLKLSNGEVWGWQCKFFGDTGRLNTGNRKKQIADSLETACRNHSNLTKWILCLKTDLTADSLSKSGRQTRGESSWFDTELPKIIPSEMNVELKLWGESELLYYLKNNKHTGTKNFFFGELEFNHKWFEAKFKESFNKVKDKYDPELHSIDKYHQSIIDFSLLDSNYINHLKILKDELLNKSNEINRSIKEFSDGKMIDSSEVIKRNNFVYNCQEFQKHISYVFEQIDFIETCFNSFNEQKLRKFDLAELNTDFFSYFENIDYSVFDDNSTTYRAASSISHLISEFGDVYNQFFRNYYHEKQNALHFIADAAKGKTHLSCDIAYQKIKKDEPAIFLTGDKFNEEKSIADGFRKILDINQQFTFDEFIQALNVYGSIKETIIPIIIDGLNETTFNRYFSNIWNNYLISFESKICNLSNIVLITTCRNSYVDRIWENTDNKNFYFLFGFEDYTTIREAVTKYFKKYNLQADLSFAPMEKFREPIFLKIFCEIKNPNWEYGNSVTVNIQEESTFDIFNEYLSQVNSRVTTSHHLFIKNENFINQSLSLLANYLWINNKREIPIKSFYRLIDGDKEYEKDNSKADVLINEGLVVTRDLRDDFEYVSFTYDTLAGYIIIKSLINEVRNPSYFISNDFIKKIIQGNKQHPLFEDILTALCFLLPQLKQTTLHELLDSDSKLKFTTTKVFKYLPKYFKKFFKRRVEFSNYGYYQSVTSLFQLPAKYVKESDTEFVSKLFIKSDQNKKILFGLFLKTISDCNHPFNAHLLSKLLFSLKVNHRDLTWTEYVRKRAYDLEPIIEEFENICKNNSKDSGYSSEKQHLLSHFIQWFLTSTNRVLRDKATRALYYYGRKFPSEYANLTYESLKINDPYVWERTLASLYGVTMADHNSLYNDKFKKNDLPDIGANIYKFIFSENASYSTTHILARDYARRTIEICLLHHPNALKAQEIDRFRPPYKDGGIRDWGEFDYESTDFEYSDPIHMDFSNYTIGHIVKNGAAYADPPEKKKVRRQIYWRIFDLGWRTDLFKDVEIEVSNSSFNSRGERAKIERYGKKYSWIGFFEVTGYLDDLELLDNEWDHFRISDADIDPSFPQKPHSNEFITEDLLGDRLIPLIDWYKNGGFPDIEKYFSMKNLNEDDADWLCMDGYICQEDTENNRRRFTFIRGFLISNSDYVKSIDLLKKQNLGGRWLPEKHENYYTFAGELYYCPESTYDNTTEFDFVIGRKKEIIKRGEPGYYPKILLKDIHDDQSIGTEFPEEIEIESLIKERVKTLMPVMEYNYEVYHSQLNNAGHTTVISKEVANHLELIDQPQTFELFEKDASKASLNIKYYEDYNNNHSLVYLRKDLLDKFLREKNHKFIWAIWGERQATFRVEKERQDFYAKNSISGPQVFQKIVEYKR